MTSQPNQLTVTASIGNSDDKLSQREWSKFIFEFDHVMDKLGDRQFFGYSNPKDPWQSVTCVVSVTLADAQVRNWDSIEEYVHGVLDWEFARLCTRFNQDSIALTIGTTQFITKEHADG